MYYNEAYEARQQEEAALYKKWEKALNADGGIKDEHMARTTAICLENYLEYLHSDARLIAEDRIQTGAFTGVNLALLGLIARVIPNLVGAELCGIQAMPTPTSPIFTLKWYKDNAKGETTAAEEMWVTPVPSNNELGLDPNYTSQIVKEIAITATTSLIPMTWANATDNLKGTKPYIFPDTMYLTAYDANGNVVCDYKASGEYTADRTFTYIAGSGIGTDALGTCTTTALGGKFVWSNSADLFVKCFETFTPSNTHNLPMVDTSSTPIDIAKWQLRYEYKGEGEANMPEMSFKITQESINLIRRQLRGKYTLDAAYDLKKLHGINIDSELANMMKIELQAEINREIVGDLRAFAGHYYELDYLSFRSFGGSSTAPLEPAGISISGNYNDAHLVLLDAIDKVCAQIWTVGRLGKANWIVANPTTLAFLDRIPGFVGSGVSYNGRELSYMGSLGGRLKFFSDPLYPKNELLIGYKGPGALDAGYLHCPYLPITATPTLLNPETGDPSKIFYTRYGKTFNIKGGQSTNVILNGKFQYARMKILNLPSPLNI